MEIISPSEINVTDTVIGKGAFGEVRIAKWRNLNVAFKRLYSGNEDNFSVRFSKMVSNDDGKTSEIQNDMNNDEGMIISPEIEMLAKLRHPNLLLFLGICRDSSSSSSLSQPSIITELMSYSLYDLLEVHKISLSLPDILDISLDIVNGLDYLHHYSPIPIIHRDISSKNILLNGNTVKIADFGQSKVFQIANMSKQTGLPGAMAYSAPEVLTGKYSTKIDIFSFGILLCQMCTNDYPRIDYRSSQIDTAIKKYSILSSVISSSLSFHPSDRPDIENIGNMLINIIENDRYYPISRNLLPESDLGIMGYHMMTKRNEEKTQELSINLEKVTKLLEIEENRWKEEAKKVDLLQHEKDELRNDFTKEKELSNIKQSQIIALNKEKEDLNQQNHDLLIQLKILSSENQSLQLQDTSLENDLKQKDLLLRQQSQEMTSLKREKKEQQAIIADFSEQYESLQQKLSLTTKQLTMQVEYCKDLDTRLEQILLRWKEEKELTNKEKLKNISLNSLYSKVIQEKEQLEEEYRRCDQKLRLFEGLPMPVRFSSVLLLFFFYFSLSATSSSIVFLFLFCLSWFFVYRMKSSYDLMKWKKKMIYCEKKFIN
jgi:serine/threonine protein kinase